MNFTSTEEGFISNIIMHLGYFQIYMRVQKKNILRLNTCSLYGYIDPLLGPKTLTQGSQEFHNFNRGIQGHHHHAFILVKILSFLHIWPQVN